MFFDFSSVFNTIWLALQGQKVAAMQVEAPVVSWIVNYLQMHVSKTKKLVVDQRRNKAAATLISIQGVPVEAVAEYSCE